MSVCYECMCVRGVERWQDICQGQWWSRGDQWHMVRPGQQGWTPLVTYSGSVSLSWHHDHHCSPLSSLTCVLWPAPIIVCVLLCPAQTINKFLFLRTHRTSGSTPTQFLLSDILLLTKLMTDKNTKTLNLFTNERLQGIAKTFRYND